jgi:hypothetical protein
MGIARTPGLITLEEFEKLVLLVRSGEMISSNLVAMFSLAMKKLTSATAFMITPATAVMMMMTPATTVIIHRQQR